MSTESILQAACVVSLFAGYGALWRLKRTRQRRSTGQDPNVLGRNPSPVQQYMAGLFKVLTGALLLLIPAHAFELDFPGLQPIASLDGPVADLLGFALGVVGLALCAVAQSTIGASWRVGIDETTPTALVTSGVYRYVRNPTYLGLYLVNAGLFVIWPTASIALFVLAFFLLMEVQVRCEEEFLLRTHGDCFRAYLSRSWRYLPFVY